MRWIARYRIKEAIQYHQRIVNNYLYMASHGTLHDSPSHNIYLKSLEDKIELERSCIRRMNRVLNRYRA